MDSSIPFFSIRQIQGTDLCSPLSGQTVRTKGIVTGVLRRGFYLQTPAVEWDEQSSDAIFVYGSDWLPAPGAFLEISGEVLDYYKHDTARPFTQIQLDQVRPLAIKEPTSGTYQVAPIIVTRELLPNDNAKLAQRLNSLEGMLLEIPAGQTFIAPSNPYGDYVLALDTDEESPGPDDSAERTEHGGVLVSAENPHRWYPGFRVTNYNHAPRLNVGAKLLSAVRGPLHYRVDAWQISVSLPFEVAPSFIELQASSLQPLPGCLTVMTLNCFNLDPHVESEARVQNPTQDIDDDWGDGRFHTLAQAIVLQAHCPDIVALQEIQDNDGAEQTEVVAADETYRLLVKTVHQLSGIEYRWVNNNPELGADGGQPGGNIRNGFLYNPERVDLIQGSVRVLGTDAAAFDDSRKPLVATFREQASGVELVCVNVHLASKRHQESIFAPVNPAKDAKLPVRIAQAELIAEFAKTALAQGQEFYITGDFNDTEHSETLAVLTGDFATNLVLRLSSNQRYDYNHRGKLQVLMHGIVSNRLAAERAEYEIIHGNELIGVKAGESTDKPSDHAYVIARLKLNQAG